MFLWTMKQEYSIFKNVPSAGLKCPVMIIFMAPLLFQVCNLLTLYVHDMHIPILTLICKAYIGVLFYAFYFLLREFVYFEHLLQGAEAANAEPVFSDRNSAQASASATLSQVSGQALPAHQGLIPGDVRTSPRRVLNHPNMLREQLMQVRYDRAREEETIINKVFPSQEMERSGKPLND